MPARPIVLVTGGGRGIGAATCRLAAARGCDVAFNYREDAGAATALVHALERLGARALAVQADVADADAVARLFETVDARLGRIDHLVNNAGITGARSRFADADPAVIRACVDINVTGALLVARAAIPRLSTRSGGRGGSIVNISSVATEFGSPNEYVWYAASKGAIDVLTLGLSKELAAEGIRVNTVSPGLTETEIHARSTGDPGRLERLAPLVPMGRIGKPEEVAEAILFLMSDAASYITGANLKVTGGR